jgi:transposase
MRIATVFRRLLGLQAIRVTAFEFRTDAFMLFFDVEPRRRGPACGRCGCKHRGGVYDTRPPRLWRHLDLGPWEVYLRAQLRRFPCPRCQTVVTEAVPWAEHASTFTREFEDVASFFAQQASKTVVGRIMKIAWPTVGSIIRRTVARRGTPLSQRKLRRLGVDEISYRRHHKYLTLVADHQSGQVVWGGEGKSAKTLDGFFDALGEEACQGIELVSLDMSAAFIASIRQRLPHAIVVFDPFHVVKLANDAVDKVRRAQVRALAGKAQAAAVKNTRWIMLKAPENLRPEEELKLALLGRVNRPLYRAYLLKEALRDVYSARTSAAARRRLSAWLAWASRSRLPPFVKLARTLRQHLEGLLAAIEHGLSNGRLEGLNSKVRLLSHRAFGFHSAEALLALVYLCCSGIHVPLPSDQRPNTEPYARVA